MFKIITDDSSYGARLFTNQSFREGDVIHRIEQYRVMVQPTYQTIQIGHNRHIEEHWVISYLNHSCQPNTHIDVERMEVIASRDIAADEELSFFYPSTEWEMARPFDCRCGSRQCIRKVAGAKHLSADILKRYFINRHVKHMARELPADIQAINVAEPAPLLHASRHPGPCRD
jgi:hypothetical protein